MVSFAFEVFMLSLVDVSLVILQTLLVNRLGLAFAAITAFAGLGGYFAASLGHLSGAGLLVAALTTALLALGMSQASIALSRERYLLGTLASLGILRALAGSIPALGGQVGMSVSLNLGHGTLQLIILAAFLCCVAIHLLVTRTTIGIYIDVARIAPEDALASVLVPASHIARVGVLFVAALAVALGALKAMYSHRINPDTFSMDTATTMLLATLLAGMQTGRVVGCGIAMFLFSDLFGVVFGYSSQAGGFLRDILLGGAILIAGITPEWSTRATTQSPRKDPT